MFCFIALQMSLNAQTAKIPQFKLGATLAVPSGFLAISNKVGYGISADAELFDINQDLKLYAEAGVLFFPGKNDGFDQAATATHIPVLAGVRYTSKSNFFIGLGLGFGFYNFGEGDKESGFAFSPHIGYSLDKFDLLMKYNNTTTSGLNANYIGISGAYKF